MIDLDGPAAAGRAGLSPHAAYNLLSSRDVQVAIQVAASRRGSRAQVYADEVLHRWWLLGGADAREITEIWYVNCRHCWGLDHEYQFDDLELRHARDKHIKEQLSVFPEMLRTEFDDLGGGSFDRFAEPCRGVVGAVRFGSEPTSDHDCPRCGGRGERHVHIHDSRNYSPAAALLYNGVKVGKDGAIHIQVRDRDAALDKVATHLGMLPRGGQSSGLPEDPTTLTNDQLETFLAQLKLLGVQPKTIEHEPTASDISIEERSPSTSG